MNISRKKNHRRKFSLILKSALSLVAVLFALTAGAQSVIVFDKAEHDFGKVKEADGAAVHDFTFKNSGSSPLIIKNVTTTCGCTTPEWTKQPIPPGKSGLIKVSYDVKGRPGTIDKTITVYSNGKPATVNLHITGEVTAVDRAPAEAFRFPMGSLRLSEHHLTFDRVWSYEKPSLTVVAYNPGAETVKIELVNLPPHITAEVSPASIGKEQKASIKLTYDAAKKNEWGFVSDRINLSLNGKQSGQYYLMVTANIQEDFSRWTAQQLQNAPAITIDQTVIEAGKMKSGEKKEYTVKLTNSGKSKLLIRKTETPSQQVKITAPKEIAAGANAELLIQYDASEQSGAQSKIITITTNDPQNSQIVLKLKAEVEP
ncbi:MAG: DUF1573 domain-containing protein [Bacteroidales bacterium]|jgi:hypothetical protein|nr:DUF1573 domain-containing protein [Bacteroidales bacterium]